LGRFQLEEICGLRNSDCVSFTIQVNFLRVLFASFFIAQTVLAYLIRDAMLMADNYNIGRNYKTIDTLRTIQDKIVTQTFARMTFGDYCSLCDASSRKNFVLPFVKKTSVQNVEMILLLIMKWILLMTGLKYL
jgi:hypothetical protein